MGSTDFSRFKPPAASSDSAKDAFSPSTREANKGKLSPNNGVYSGDTAEGAAKASNPEHAAADAPWPFSQKGAGVSDSQPLSAKPRVPPSASESEIKPASEVTPDFVPEPKPRPVRDGAVDMDRKLSFDQIHEKYEEKIFNVILRYIGGDRDDAADLTVITFVNAFKAWDRFRGESSVSTWLHQIAYNNCKNHFKAKDRQREREVLSLDDSIETDSGGLSREVADWTHAPEKKLLDQELALQIKKAVEALPPDYRVVLLLANDDMSYEEIASITNLSVPAVKTRLHRARSKMRQRLEPYYRNITSKNG